MKLIWKKSLALLLSVAMLLPSAVISVGAEDDVSNTPITGQFTYPRMGALFSDGEPRTGTDVYYYRDSWFTLNPIAKGTEGDAAWAAGLSDLVVLSMQMSLTIGGEGENWAQYSAALLQKLGFEDIETNYNAENPPAELALFAHKKIGSRDLVFVLPRGNDYGKNWVNNFDVGSGSGDHAGFRKAAYDIEDYLIDYLSRTAVSEDCKYWITGYSRGAAIANLIGSDIAKSRSTSGGGWDTEKQKDLFVFTFACPNVSELQSGTAADYPCIYNFFSVNDLVVQLPPEDMTGNPSKFLPYGPTYPLETLWAYEEKEEDRVSPAEAEKAMLTFLRALDPSFYNDVMQGPSGKGNGQASSFQNAEIASSKTIGDVFPNLPQWIGGYAPSDLVGSLLGTLGGSVIADAAEKGLTTEADSTISSMVNLIYDRIIGSLAAQTVSQAVGLQTASEAERGYTLYGLLELKDEDTQSEFLNDRVNDVWTGVLNGWRVSTLKSESGAPMADLTLREIYNEKYQSAIMAANALVFDHGKALSDAFSSLYDAKNSENTKNIKELITAVLLTYNYCVADQKDTAGTYLTKDLDQLDVYAGNYSNIDRDNYVELWNQISAKYGLNDVTDVGVKLKSAGDNILEFHNALLSKRSGSGAFALLRTLTAAAENYLLTGSDSDLDTFLNSWASLAAMEGLSALHSIEVSGTTITPSYADYLLIQNNVDELAREICKTVLASNVDLGWDYYLGDPDSGNPYLTYYYDRAARSLGVVAKDYLQSVCGKLFDKANISYTEDGDGKTVYDNIYLLADFLSYTLFGLDQPGALIESSNGSDEVWMDTLNVAATLYHNYKRLIYAHFPGVYLSYVKAQLGSVYVQPSLAEGAYTGAQTVTLTPLGDDGTGTVQYRINNGSWTNGNLANTTTSITLPAGTTSLSTRIYDAKNLTEADDSLRTFAYTVNSSGGGGGSSSGGDWSGGGSSGGSVRPTPTTKPADPTTTTVTNPDGSTSTITTSTASDGTITISATTSTGSTGTTVMSASGNTVSATTTISENALQAAAAAGKPVTAPVAIVPVPSSALDAAPVVHVTMPASVKGYTSVADMPKVEIQVSSVTPGTVVYRRSADGSTTLIKECSTGDDSVIVPVDGSCDLIAAYNTRAFTDVQNHWARDRIEFVTAREIFNGSGTKFDPDGTMTRAMVAQIVYNYDRFSTRGIRSDFVDVPADEWFANSIGWASEQGVVGGYGTKFLPTDSVTRQDLIAILYRYARSAGYNVNADENLDVYPDAASVSEYARPAMQWALSTGIIGGTDRGLEPLNLATRAEVAAIMARFVIKFA